MNNKIYKITVFFGKHNQHISKEGSMLGFYFNLDDAKKAVSENRNDFCDNWYTYCMISESPEGVSVADVDKIIQWYKFGPRGEFYNKCKWTPIKKKPKCLDHIIDGWTLK